MLGPSSVFIDQLGDTLQPKQISKYAPQVTITKDDGLVDFEMGSWSPDGTQIAVVGDSPIGSIKAEILVIDLATGNSRQLTSGGFDHSNPIWSPDGRYLAYNHDGKVSYVELESGEITAMNLKGKLDSWIE